MSELWLPGAAGPQDELVRKIHLQIDRFVQTHPGPAAMVEVELRDGPRATLASLSPEPGFGFVTLCPHPEEGRGEAEEWIVPVGALARIVLREAEEHLSHFGFALPDAG